MPKRLWVTGAAGAGLGWLLAACSSGGATVPPLPPCTATGDTVALGLAAYAAVDPGLDSGCTVYPANTSGGPISYLLVPQAVNGVADDSSAFRLRGGALTATAPAMADLVAAGAGTALPAQAQFDLALRRAERQLALRAGPMARPQAAAPVTAAAPVVGSVGTFKVCGKITSCSPFVTVTATAKTVGQHIAVYIDKADSAAGDTLPQADLDTLAAVFDTLLYPRDTAAFGRESDIDANGVVIVLMTGKVNSLVSSSDCLTKGFVAGFFYGGDLIPAFQGGSGNDGEIFYSLVPDPTGKLSCQHSATSVMRLVPVTFIHEFQHMISFNQHYLLHGTAPEDLWLNEGLSHYAEELGGRRYLQQLAPDSVTFCRFVFGDLYNAGQYFARPDTSFLVDTLGIGDLASRGAYWLFVRFLTDRFGPVLGDADSVTRRLENTTLTGPGNVANATGTPFATLVGHWALANYVSDLGGFTAPGELTYTTWRFRSDYPTMHTRCSTSLPSVFPLVPASGTASAVNLSGVMRGGSGTYFIAQQANGATGFTLLFSNGTGGPLRASLMPRLNVIRIQ